MTPEDFERLSTEEIWNLLPDLNGLPKADAFHELSNRLFAENKFEMSASTAEQCVNAAKEVPDLVLAGKATWRQGMCAYKQRQYKDAIVHFKQAAVTCDEAGDQYGLANALNWVADAALVIDDFDTALPHAVNALEIGEAEEFIYISGWAAHFAAKATYFKSKDRSALEFSIRARNNFRKGSDLSMVSMVDDFAATIHDNFEEYDQALNLLRSCLNIAEATVDKHDDPYANRRIGNAYSKVRLYDDALHHLSKARAAYQKHEDLRSVAYCDREIADALYMLDRDREALTTLERAQSLFDSMGDDPWVRSCLIKRGQIHEYLNEHHLSERLWKQVLVSMESDPNFDNGNRYCWAKLSLANQYLDTDRFPEALALIDSLNGIEFVPADWNLIRKHTLRARALNSMNRTNEALAEVEAALSLTTDENLDSGTAYLYEIRGTHLLEAGKKAGERDIAHAIAIHLASGEDNRARDLAKVFIPTLDHEKDLGLGETTLQESEDERSEQATYGQTEERDQQ